MSRSKTESATMTWVACCAVVGAVLLGAAGCAPKSRAALTDTELRNIDLKVRPGEPNALLVGGDEVTCDQVISLKPTLGFGSSSLVEQFRAAAKGMEFEDFRQKVRPAVEQKVNAEITAVLFYHRARAELGDKEKANEAIDKAAEKELRAFVMEHGGDEAAADEALRAENMTRESFKRNKIRQLMAQYYVAPKLRARPVTHSELVEEYNRLKDELFLTKAMVLLSVIEIDVSKVKPDPNGDRIAAAVKLGDDLVKRVRAGEDFGELAKTYSNGFRAEAGGLWPPRDPASLAPPYDLLATEAKKMKVGDVAGPIRAGMVVFVMKLEDERPEGYEPLKKVQPQVEENIYGARRVQALVELEGEVKRQIELGQTRRFVDYCIEQLYRRARL